MGQLVLAIDRGNRFFHIEPSDFLVKHRKWDSNFTFYNDQGHVMQITKKPDGSLVFQPIGVAGDSAIPLQRLNSAVTNLARQLENDKEIRYGRQAAVQMRTISGDLPTKMKAMHEFRVKGGSFGAHSRNRLHNMIHRVFR